MGAATCAAQDVRLSEGLVLAQLPGINNGRTAASLRAGRAQHGPTGIFGPAGLVSTTINGADGLGWPAGFYPAGFYTDCNVISVVGLPTRWPLETRTVP